jgi:hypothetical protein
MIAQISRQIMLGFEAGAFSAQSIYITDFACHLLE